MRTKTLVSVVVAGMAMFLVNTGRADIPAPPVNQDIGMADDPDVGGRP